MPSLEHLRFLANRIGSRGSTTPGERKAAEYAQRALRKAGQQASLEEFTSARSTWHPFALFTGLLIACEAVFWIGGRWASGASLLIGAVSLASVLRELAFRPNPLRWILPKGRSQNVVAKLPPRTRRQPAALVVLMGHLDTHRTPLVFSTDGWVRLFQAMVPVGLACAVALILLFALGVLMPGWSPLHFISLPFAAGVLVLFALTLQADFSPYTAGANDNASGAALVLGLAERLGMEPLPRTTVWAVLSGCEEVGCYGADAFARSHHQELEGAFWIVLDMVAGADTDPGFVRSETFLLTVKCDPLLKRLAERVIARHPELGVVSYDFRGAYTEQVIGNQHGLRALTLSSLPRVPGSSEWHRPSDTVKRIDPDVLRRSEAFVWHLLHEIDQQA